MFYRLLIPPSEVTLRPLGQLSKIQPALQSFRVKKLRIFISKDNEIESEIFN